MRLVIRFCCHFCRFNYLHRIILWSHFLRSHCPIHSQNLSPSPVRKDPLDQRQDLLCSGNQIWFEADLVLSHGSEYAINRDGMYYGVCMELLDREVPGTQRNEGIYTFCFCWFRVERSFTNKRNSLWGLLVPRGYRALPWSSAISLRKRK